MILIDNTFSTLLINLLTKSGETLFLLFLLIPFDVNSNIVIHKLNFD